MIGAPVVAVCDATDVTGIRVALSEVMDNDEGRVKADAAGRAFAARHRWRDVAAEHLSLWRHGR
jgi:hypothetical protein